MQCVGTVVRSFIYGRAADLHSLEIFEPQGYFASEFFTAKSPSRVGIYVEMGFLAEGGTGMVV